MKNTYERFVEEICSNCKDKKQKDCEIRKRLDGTLYCEPYERASRPEKKKKPEIVTAKQSKPLMKGLV